METKYYYLGLEARTRTDNRYWDLEEAKKTASFAAKRLNVPIRIFAMKANNHSEMVLVITPDEAPLCPIEKVYSL